ncbi:threonine synthase [Lactobacillus sp. S2-2]|uniref:threonine synthase n=1 Tax=Lactobacillus sp. S2-2 TaxID=2692917 RepID=UPI001F01AACC|nr:threonine synthase [Lactobacillus sp. S2-2]MCF6515362.1 threonine synthase [Lactobacillus sp. S2-2]
MPTKYTSTRNHIISASPKEAMLKGLASNNGLFVLNELGENKINLKEIMQKDYLDMGQEILQILLPDFSKKEIHESLHNAYYDTFSSPKIAPVQSVNDFHILELFHGPTAAFKDFGLQLLPELMERAITLNQKIMILTATSGDTGTAALNGFKNIDKFGISVFYPENGVSPIQKQQMLTTNGINTNVASIAGNFDDAQKNVKEIFNNQSLLNTLSDNVSLSSANSINIGRLIPQVVYYFNAYKELLEKEAIKLGDKINFTVPTGNFGDALAGYYAKLLGLPINKIIIACNQNNVLTDFFNEGIYDRNRDFFKTVAPSMDIQISSNFERLLYYESGKDDQYIKSLMADLEKNGKYQVKPELLKNIKSKFASYYASDKEIKTAINQVFKEEHYLMDPHTAAGYLAMKQYQNESDDNCQNVLLSTANPYKFVETVSDAILGSHENDPIKTTQKLAKYTQIEVPISLQNLFNKEVKVESVINPNDMTQFVQQKVKEVFSDDNN